MKTLKQLRGILELPPKQEESIQIGRIKTPLEEDVEKQLRAVVKKKKEAEEEGGGEEGGEEEY